MKIKDNAARVKESRIKRGSRKADRLKHKGKLAKKRALLVLRYLIIVLILDCCRKKAKQVLLRQQAQKYVARITYADPIFRKYGIK